MLEVVAYVNHICFSSTSHSCSLRLKSSQPFEFSCVPKTILGELFQYVRMHYYPEIGQ